MTNVFVNWFPLHPSCMVQPYFGVGLNYTDYGDERFTAFRGLDPEFDNLRGDFNLGHSWGFAWQAGVDFVFGRDSAWLVNASATYVDAETDMGFQIFEELLGAAANEELIEAYSGDYRYNPWVFNLGIGYKFSF
jgi:outer membrane protein